MLTANASPLDFLGVDKTLRCSVVRGLPLYAGSGGACGTFVALGATVYGPADVLEGTTPFTPVSQVATIEGDVAKLVTTVALGDTGVKVRQTDAYQAGRGWYRTDTALVNDGDAPSTATIYRAAECNIGPEAERRRCATPPPAWPPARARRRRPHARRAAAAERRAPATRAAPTCSAA